VRLVMPTNTVIANLEILSCGHVESGDGTNTLVNLKFLRKNERWDIYISPSSTHIKYVIVFFVSHPGRFGDSVFRHLTCTSLFFLNSCTFKLFLSKENAIISLDRYFTYILKVLLVGLAS
jgi:hypothetical protein